MIFLIQVPRPHVEAKSTYSVKGPVYYEDGVDPTTDSEE
jgi:hypothetical protein